MIPYRFSFLFSFVLLYMAYRAWLLRRRFSVWHILAAMLFTGAVLCCSNDLTHTETAEAFGIALRFRFMRCTILASCLSLQPACSMARKR